jgi:surface carbohydrate biosynthesis protein
MKLKSHPSRHRRVVILVDNRTRDLLAACIFGWHLEQSGIEVFYEPVDATFAVLAAYQPDAIVFNHLTASHLVRYSHRLKELGVCVAVMMNEGIAYTREEIDFLALKAHKSSHVDVFLCWSEPFREALLAHRPELNAPVVSIPRFDTYFEPFRSFYRKRMDFHPGQTEILVCTNYVFAKYHEMPEKEADTLLADWSKSISALKDYHHTCEVVFRNRGRLFPYLIPLLADGRFHVTLRPHPNEDHSFYLREIDKIPVEFRKNLTFRPDGNIAELICGCDLEISMDSCTTAKESWIAGKPTVELPMEADPAITRRFEGLNVECTSPDQIVRLVEENLRAVDGQMERLRQEHLAYWYGAPDGKAGQRAADALLSVLLSGPRPNSWNKLTFAERRKGLKLNLLKVLGLPYGWKAGRELQRLFRDTALMPYDIVRRKTILPQHVAETRRLVQSLYQRTTAFR